MSFGFQIPVIKAKIHIAAFISLSRTMLHLLLQFHRGFLTVDTIYTNFRERPSIVHVEMKLSSMSTEAPAPKGFLNPLAFFFRITLTHSINLTGE